MKQDYITNLIDEWERNCRKLIPQLDAQLLYGLTDRDVFVDVERNLPLSYLDVLAVTVRETQ